VTPRRSPRVAAALAALTVGLLVLSYVLGPLVLVVGGALLVVCVLAYVARAVAADGRRPQPTGRRKSPPPPVRPAGHGLIGDGDMDQAFGFASPGGIMALAAVRGLKTKGWTRVASWVLVGAFLCGAVAILVSTVSG